MYALKSGSECFAVGNSLDAVIISAVARQAAMDGIDRQAIEASTNWSNTAIVLRWYDRAGKPWERILHIEGDDYEMGIL